MNINQNCFALYTGKLLAKARRPRQHVTLKQLLRIPGLWARAENSGCEGCYCEVAKWNRHTRRWERFAFEKYFGGEFWDGLSDADTAMRVAGIINRCCGDSLYVPNSGVHPRYIVMGRPVQRASIVDVRQQEVTSVIHSFPSWNPTSQPKPEDE